MTLLKKREIEDKQKRFSELRKLSILFRVRSSDVQLFTFITESGSGKKLEYEKSPRGIASDESFPFSTLFYIFLRSVD